MGIAEGYKKIHLAVTGWIFSITQLLNYSIKYLKVSSLGLQSILSLLLKK
jgi:hypothetical protein